MFRWWSLTISPSPAAVGKEWLKSTPYIRLDMRLSLVYSFFTAPASQNMQNRTWPPLLPKKMTFMKMMFMSSLPTKTINPKTAPTLPLLPSILPGQVTLHQSEEPRRAVRVEPRAPRRGGDPVAVFQAHLTKPRRGTCSLKTEGVDREGHHILTTVGGKCWMPKSEKQQT